MKSYEAGDTITIYFILKTISLRGKHTLIRAWTDDKVLAHAYMEFHKCPSLILKKRIGIVNELNKILEDNYHDEINIANLYTKVNDKLEFVAVPITENELDAIKTEIDAGLTNIYPVFSLIPLIPLFKDKYASAFTRINDALLSYKNIIDEVSIHIRYHSEDFGL